MLDTMFYLILNMSIASCFVIVVLLVVRQIKLLPKRVVYPLWALAFFRLIMPFTLPTNWSLFNITSGLVKRLVTVETITQGTASSYEPGSMIMMNTIGAVDQYVPIKYKTEALRQIFTIASIIWAVLAAAALIAAAILYMLTRKELNKAVYIKDNLYRSDMLLTPVLTGLIRPKLILPVSLDPDSAEGRMVQMHENVHKHRLDNLWRILGICIVSLHWFNPLAWIMLKAFFTDMELSCDESVIKSFNTEERKAYAQILLNFAEDKRLLVSTAFGCSGVKVRIINVLNYKKLTMIGAAASLLFLLVVAVVLATNPQIRG